MARLQTPTPHFSVLSVSSFFWPRDQWKTSSHPPPHLSTHAEPFSGRCLVSVLWNAVICEVYLVFKKNLLFLFLYPNPSFGFCKFQFWFNIFITRQQNQGLNKPLNAVSGTCVGFCSLRFLFVPLLSVLVTSYFRRLTWPHSCVCQSMTVRNVCKKSLPAARSLVDFNRFNFEEL